MLLLSVLGTIGVGDALGILTMVISLVLAYVGMKAKLDEVLKQNKELLGIKAEFEANTRAVEQVSHYIKWLVKQETGSEPPPRIDGD